MSDEIQAVAVEAIDASQFNPETIEDVIYQIVQDKVELTDLLIHEDQTIKLRQANKITNYTDWIVTRELITDFFDLLDAQWQENIKLKSIDKAMSLSTCRIRVNCFQYMGGTKLGAVIRKFPIDIPDFEQIGLSLNARAMANVSSGLVLVIGDTCQGKSTTLAALINEINKTKNGHIITIEDPIEMIFSPDKCVITQREVGPKGDVLSYYAGGIDALRERPDVVMFGEIRDAETANQALMLSQSGPVVFGTLHAKTPEQGLIKFIRLLGDEDSQTKAFASSLKGIICQALIPLIDSDKFVLVTEVLKNSENFQSHIEKNKMDSIRASMETQSSSSKDDGTHVMNLEILNLLKYKKITLANALKASTAVNGLKSLVVGSDT